MCWGRLVVGRRPAKPVAVRPRGFEREGYKNSSVESPAPSATSLSVRPPGICFTQINSMQIHRYEKKAKSKLQRLEENPNLSTENKQILRKFYNSLVAEGLSFGRIDRYLDFIINYIIPNIKENLSKFTDDELLEIPKTIRENQKLSEHTKYCWTTIRNRV